METKLSGEVSMRKVFVSVFVVVLLCVEVSFGWTVEGSAAGECVGFALAKGDVNGDGYIDAIIGSNSNVKVYNGLEFGLSASPSATFSVSTLVRSGGLVCADFNNDGYADVAYTLASSTSSAYLIYGSASGLTGSPISFTTKAKMLTTGDVNGDGYADLFIGKYNIDSVYGYYGSAGGLTLSAPNVGVSVSAGGYFGYSICTSDLNSDGYSDLVVGAMEYTNGQTKEGDIFIYYGTSSGIPTAWDLDNEGNTAYGYHGTFVADAGDVDNDGYKDIAVSTKNNGTWRVCVYFGQAAFGFKKWEYVSNYATGISSADVNGDGYSDLILGSVYSNGQSNEGQVSVFNGTASGISTSSSWSFESDNANAYMSSTLGLGDLDKDGYDDFLVSAGGFTNLYSSAGKVWLFYGSPTGPSATPTVPATPSLVSPTNGATNQAITVSLKWNKVTRTQTYNLQIATDAGFSNKVVDQTGLTDTVYSPTLTNGQTYYWRVASVNEGGASAWSTSRSFTTIVAAPDAVTLSNPADGATNQPVNLTLSWNASARATSYTVVVSPNSNFSSPIVDETTTSLTKDLSGLNNNRTYYWRVKATNIGGESVWSSRSFTTIVALPATPTLASPADGATGIPVNQVISWNASENASEYDVVVSTNSDFSSPIVNTSKTGTSHDLTGLLSNLTTYYWRVRATNVAGNSSWASRSFTTIIAVAGAPVLASPANNATDVAVNTSLSWNAVSTAVSYDVQVATNSGFTTPIINQNTTNLTYGPLSLVNGTVYYWRVRAVNAGGNGAWSTAQFTTIVAVAGVPVLTSPANNAINVPLSPTLTWNAVTGATSYDVQVADNAGFTSPIFDGNVIETSKSVFYLTENTVYYWRVRSVNAGGASAWTTAQFTTVPPIPGAVTILTPAEAQVFTVNTVTVTWNRLDFADSFVVSVAGKDTVLADTVLVLSNLDNAGYTVTIHAKNVSGDGAYVTRTFTVDVPSTLARVLQTGMRVTGTSVGAGRVSFTLAKDSPVHLAVYDLAGRTIMAVDKVYGAGPHIISLSNLSRGSYTVAFKTEGYQKKTLVKTF